MSRVSHTASYTDLEIKTSRGFTKVLGHRDEDRRIVLATESGIEIV